MQAAAALLQLSDLLGDVLTSFLALYLVDEVGMGGGGAALGLAVWAGAGLVGDGLAVPVLDRLDGRVVVRVQRRGRRASCTPRCWSSIHYRPSSCSWLCSAWRPRGGTRCCRLGSTPTLPGRSGVAVSLGSVSGILFGVVPLTLGLVAERFGLEPMMWLLLAGPLALVIGLRR